MRRYILPLVQAEKARFAYRLSVNFDNDARMLDRLLAIGDREGIYSS
jgi:hypothetical protein